MPFGYSTLMRSSCAKHVLNEDPTDFELFLYGLQDHVLSEVKCNYDEHKRHLLLCW